MAKDDFNPHGYGSLGGVGAEGFEEIKTSVAKDGSGVEFIVPCNGCARETAVTVEWGELILMAHKRQPPQWTVEAAVGAFMPLVACRCGARVPLGITPDECVRHVKAGEANGKISPQQVQAFMQQHGLR